MSNSGTVEKVTLKDFRSGHGNSSSTTEQDGFFVGADSKWHDPSGEVCHTCTPENGFPAQKNHSKDEREIDVSTMTDILANGVTQTVKFATVVPRKMVFHEAKS